MGDFILVHDKNYHSDMYFNRLYQEHLPKHKPAPDTLVQMATSASAVEKNSNGAAGNKAKAAGNTGKASCW